MTATIDYQMELIMELYNHMDERDIENWSYEAAESVVADQKLYESTFRNRNFEFDVSFIYNSMCELIAQEKE